MKLLLIITAFVLTATFNLTNDHDNIKPITAEKEESSRGTHRYAGVPPTAKTGAPNEGSCYDCHATGTLNGGGGDIYMNFNSGFNFYKPDSIYTINVTVKESGKMAFGFESTVLDSIEVKTGVLAVTNPITTTFQTMSGRDYISHNNTANNLNNDSTTWQFNWTAPSSNVGRVIIYSAGVAHTNLASGPFGNVYNDSLIIYPDSSLWVGQENVSSSIEQVTIFPNPVSSELNISTISTENYELTIYNAVGQILYNENGISEINKKLNVTSFKRGLLFIRVESEGKVYYSKILKQ